jgi:hypothetical protein
MRRTLLLSIAVIVLTQSPVLAVLFQWQVLDGGNGHLYEVVIVPNGCLWETAYRWSNLAGGHLVTLTTQAEHDYVLSLIIDQPQCWSNVGSFYKAGPWIGAYQQLGSIEPDGGWVWVTNEPFEYVNWIFLQPDDGPAQSYGEKCMAFLQWTDGDNRIYGWNDRSVNVNSPAYIVEYEDSFCGDPEHHYPIGDINKDCKVNIEDLALLANNWLECTAPECD